MCVSAHSAEVCEAARPSGTDVRWCASSCLWEVTSRPVVWPDLSILPRKLCEITAANLIWCDSFHELSPSLPYKSSPASSLSSVRTDIQARWVRTLRTLVPPELHLQRPNVSVLLVCSRFNEKCLRLSPLCLFSWPVLWLWVPDRVSRTTGDSVFGATGLNRVLLVLIDGRILGRHYVFILCSWLLTPVWQMFL